MDKRQKKCESPLNGQNFKTRGHYTELLYNYIADSQDGEIGFADEADTTPLPNSHAVMIGNVVISKPRLSGYNSGRFINFGQDSGNAHNGTLFAYNNTFIAGDGRIQFLSASATGATIVAWNNIFYGSASIVGTTGGGVGGADNWMPSGATVPGSFSSTTQGTSPGVVDLAGRDFHLTSSSACRDKAAGGLTYLDGNGISHSGVPVWEYVNHMQRSPRSNDGKLDIGAYEYNSGVSSNAALGTPILWLQQNGFTDNFDAAELTDLDGDGALAWQEYQAGTVPTDKLSVFRILQETAATGLPSSLSLSWYGTTNSGATNGFGIYRSQTLTPPDWQLITSGIPRVVSGTNAAAVACSGPTAYYRIAVPVQ